MRITPRIELCSRRNVPSSRVGAPHPHDTFNALSPTKGEGDISQGTGGDNPSDKQRNTVIRLVRAGQWRQERRSTTEAIRPVDVGGSRREGIYKAGRRTSSNWDVKSKEFDESSRVGERRRGSNVARNRDHPTQGSVRKARNDSQCKSIVDSWIAVVDHGKTQTVLNVTVNTIQDNSSTQYDLGTATAR